MSVKKIAILFTVLFVSALAHAAPVCRPLAQALEDVLAKNSATDAKKGAKATRSGAGVSETAVDEKNVTAAYDPSGPPVYKAQTIAKETSTLKKFNVAKAKKEGVSLDDLLTKAGPDGSVKNLLGAEVGKIVSPETVQGLSGETKSFVVFKNKKMVAGGSHSTMAQGTDVASAGEIRFQIGANGKVEEVDINLKSGNYRLSDKVAAFRAAVRSLLEQGIVPEKIVLRDYASDADILKEKVFATLTPPYSVEAVRGVTKEAVGKAAEQTTTKTAQVTADSNGAVPTSPDSAGAIPKQRPQTFISGHFKEGSAFAGKVINDDGNTIMLQTKNGADEPIIMIKRDQIEPGSVNEGRVKVGSLTPGGRRVTNVAGPEPLPPKVEDVSPQGEFDLSTKSGKFEYNKTKKSIHISGGAEGSYGGTAGDLKFFSQTDHGMGHPQNEDAVFAGRTRDGSMVFISIDGMSKPAAGRIAAETIAKHVQDQLAQGKTVEEALNSIPHALWKRLGQGDGALPRMGATLSSVEIKDGQAVFRHVGDSKGMVVRDGAVQFVTKDHSLYEEVMSNWDKGGREEKIKELVYVESTHGRNLDRAQAEKLADQYYQDIKASRGHSVVTRAYTPEWTERFEPNTVALQKKDRVVLASDGLWDNMSQDEVAKIVNEAGSPEEAAQKIRDAVGKTMGTTGKPDNFNITVIFN